MARYAFKVVSGGQTGVDRGALEAAMESGLETGGWCPRGRLAEDGRIPERYAVLEFDSGRYEARTEQNVIDSGATLVLCRQQVSGGTQYTCEMAEHHGRPCLVVDPDAPDSISATRDWLKRTLPDTLNVAGPRESKDAGIQELARKWLIRLFSEKQEKT